MKVIILLTVSYICILIFQMLYIKYASSIRDPQLEEKAKFNRENKVKILNYFKKILKERLNLLNSNKMNYDEWIDYNNKNIIVPYDDKHKYYIFLWEFLPENNNAILRVLANEKLLNLSWVDVLKVNNEKLLFTKYTTDLFHIQNFYDTAKDKKFNEIKYNWLDPLTQKTVLKKSVYIKWEDKETGKSGVIGIGIDLEYLDDNNTFFYFNELGYKYPFFISLLTYVMSIILYKLKGETHPGFKAIIFLFITNVYLTIFLTKHENYGSNNMENKKKENINSGILSVSFLVGINIFILNTFQKSLKRDLFVESGFVFCVSVMMLLLATIKNTNFMSTDEVLKSRLISQMIFNFSIVLNSLIIINYIIYLLSYKLS